MAQLAIAVAINIAIAVAINALFPPPDIEQSGPRLTDLDFTGASYGKFINIIFGTDRVGGTFIDNTDPAIEEVVNEEGAGGGLFKGGGPDVTTTTYSYFLTTRILYAIEGAAGLVRMWADGKLIYDRLGTGAVQVSGMELTFYAGGPNQDTDPEEVSRRGVDIPAYGHLTSVKLDRLPLANFGNRIPNFTAEISYNATATTAFQNIDTTPAGFNPPGTDLNGKEWQYYDTERDMIIGLVGGQGYTMNSNMEFDTMGLGIGACGTSAHAGYTDGFIFNTKDCTNHSPMQVFDVETGEMLTQFGSEGSLPTADRIANSSIGSNGESHGLKCVLPTMGLVKHAIVHSNGLNNTRNGSWCDLEKALEGGAAFDDIVLTNFGQTFLPLSDDMSHGFWIPDPFRINDFSDIPAFGVMWWFGPDNANSEYVLVKMRPSFVMGINPITQAVSVGQETPSVDEHRRFAFADFPSGTGDATGWALNITNGDLILCNGSSMILYNPEDDLILATKNSGQLSGRNNYYSGSTMGMASGGITNGTATLFDTRTLETLETLDLEDVGWTPDNPIIAEEPCVWDDKAQALYISRQDDVGGINGVDAIVKLFLNQISTENVGLDFINQKLSTTYQRYRMAGLEDADVDVTDLAGLGVPGFTINRDSTVKAAFQPLRNRFLYDIFQSDWIVKFELRGKSSAVTIPEEFVGELKRGRSITDEPPMVETRLDDLELPMRMNVRYKNKDMDYDVDVEHDKRWVDTNPTMSSLDEQTLDIPIVDTPENMKQVAQKWLWTLWNERVTYNTVIPWTYITLDPSDVFQIGAFGETIQLRMNEMDIGLSYSLGINGAVEDVKSVSSTLGGGTALGFTQKFIGSSLPSRVFPLDCPLLSVADQQIAEVSNGYVAFGAFEDSWPGATLFRSEDNNNWAATAAGNVEAATAKVVTPPSTWGFSDDSATGLAGVQFGDFRNRIQEVSEGGTMVINPLRREDVWNTVTEEQMYNGANTFAVITSSGVEIIQYIDATVNDEGTITLERLLRGRLGTEDIADADTMGVSNEIVVLTDSNNVKQSAAITKQNILTSNLNISFFYRGVTLGGLLEDAAVVSFIYTGRDILPFSVANLKSVDDEVDTFDITWERRCRGPQAAEWEDLTGEVSLNEARERYTLEVLDESDNILATHTIDEATTFGVPYSEAFSVAPPSFVRVRQESAISGFSSPDTVMAKTQLTEPGHILVVESDTAFYSTGVLGGGTAPVLGNSVGDVLIVACNGSNLNNANTSPFVDDPAFDFVQIDTGRDDLRSSLGTGRTASLFYRVMTGSEPVDGIYDFSWATSAYINLDTILLRFVDLTLLPAATGFEDGGIPSSSTVVAADFTTAGNNAIAIFNAASRTTSHPHTLPPNFEWEQSRSFTGAASSNDDHFGGVGITEFPLAGPTGTQTWIWTSVSFNLKAFNYGIFEAL